MGTMMTRKGQVTIPKPVRDRLGIVAGNEVRFELTARGDVVLVKVESAALPAVVSAVKAHHAISA
jgi:AbrB family looped-hinge helix DNA binding protein